MKKKKKNEDKSFLKTEMHLTIWSLYITVLDNRILCLRLILISDTVQLKVLETGDWVHIDRRKYKRQLRQFESALYRRISRIILLESDQNPATFLFVNTQKNPHGRRR